MRTLRMVSAAAAALLLAAPALAQTVGMATNTQGAFTHSAGSAIAKVVSENSDLRMRVQPFAGSSVYVPEVNAGDIEFGLANVFETYLAFNGGEYFKGRKNTNLRILSVMLPFRVSIYVRADSDIRSIKDLKGRPFPSGWTSQAILRPIMRAHLANAGLTPADLKPVRVANANRSADDFLVGKSVGFMGAFGSDKVRQVAAKVKVRVLPIDDSPAAMAALRKHVPVAYAVTISNKRFPGITGPTKVLGYAYLVLSGTKTSNDAAYKVAKAMHKNRKGMIASFRAMAEFEPDKMAQDFSSLGLQYHPGAIKYYKELGVWPPKISGLGAK